MEEKELEEFNSGEFDSGNRRSQLEMALSSAAQVICSRRQSGEAALEENIASGVLRWVRKVKLREETQCDDSSITGASYFFIHVTRRPASTYVLLSSMPNETVTSTLP